MKFYTLYKGIVEKIGDDEKLLKQLEEKIASNNALAKQFLISEALTKKGKQINEAEELIGFSEEYMRKLTNNEVMAANRELAHYFNLDYDMLKESTIDEAIDELVQYTTGGITPLVPSYRKNLIEALTQTEHKSQLSEETLQVIREELSSEGLNLLESEMINIVAQNNFPKIESKLKTITILAESLSLRDKTFVNECVKLIKDQVNISDLKESAYKTYDLYDTVMGLLEQNALVGGVVAEDISHLKNVKVCVLKESDKKLITFELHFNPISKSYKTLQESCNRLDKQVYYLGKKTFSNWDSIVLSEHIKLDDIVVCSGQVFLEGDKDLTEELNKLNDLFASSFKGVLKSNK